MPQLIQPWVVFLVHRILCNAHINVAPRKALELIEEFRNDGHMVQISKQSIRIQPKQNIDISWIWQKCQVTKVFFSPNCDSKGLVWVKFGKLWSMSSGYMDVPHGLSQNFGKTPFHSLMHDHVPHPIAF